VVLRRALLGVSQSQTIKRAITRAPVTKGVVARYVAGDRTADALAVSARLVGAGLSVTIDHLGEDTLDRAQADAVTTAYVRLLDGLSSAGLAGACEVSMKLTALGLALGADGSGAGGSGAGGSGSGGSGAGRSIAVENARRICSAARSAGTTVTVDMEDHTTTDATLEVVSELRADFPQTGAVLQAYLRRTEADCRDLAYEGSRIRLCKGAYNEPESVAFRDRHEVDKSYIRCLRVLIDGPGKPLIATHDPTLIDIASTLLARSSRTPDSYEFQMLYGIRPTEQQRLANAGHTMRVYLPYGTDWYGYLVRRLAERPANLTFFARSLVSRS
jgi:proline dehydrogenase